MGWFLAVFHNFSAIASFRTALSFLRTLGFDEPGIQMERSRLEGNVLRLVFSSVQAGRAISISYVAAQNGRPNVVVVLVKRSDGDKFSLDDWLTINGKRGEVPLSSDEAPELNEIQFIEQFCLAFKRLAYHELHDVLTGKDWQEVPIDWKGYR